jgi:hypothetical protein
MKIQVNTTTQLWYIPLLPYQLPKAIQELPGCSIQSEQHRRNLCAQHEAVVVKITYIAWSLNPLKSNGNYMYYLLQQSVTLHFVFHMILGINSANQLMFVMVKCCVFLAVWSEFLNII